MEIQVNRAVAVITKSETITTDSINSFNIQFLFDSTWDAMTNRTVVFYQPSNPNPPYTILLGNDNIATIPYDCVIKDDILYIGVYGFNDDGSIVLPTIFVYTYISRGCYVPSETPSPPPQSVYTEIYNIALNSYNMAQEVQRSAESGEFSSNISVRTSTATEYILTITNPSGETYDTPNLKAMDGSLEASQIILNQIVGLDSNNVQDAVEELVDNINSLESVVSSNTTSIEDLQLKSFFMFNQAIPSSEWIINHNLNKYPAVTVVDSSNTVYIGEVVYTDLNNLRISLSGSFSGKAYLN